METGCRLYARVGRWTSEKIEESRCQRVQGSLLPAICDSSLIQTARKPSYSCRDTSEKLGSCDGVNDMLKRSVVCTHVRNAMSGILITLHFSTRSWWNSQENLFSSPLSSRLMSDFRDGLASGGSSSSSRSLSDKYP